MSKPSHGGKRKGDGAESLRSLTNAIRVLGGQKSRTGSEWCGRPGKICGSSPLKWEIVRPQSGYAKRSYDRLR